MRSSFTCDPRRSPAKRWRYFSIEKKKIPAGLEATSLPVALGKAPDLRSWPFDAALSKNNPDMPWVRNIFSKFHLRQDSHFVLFAEF